MKLTDASSSEGSVLGGEMIILIGEELSKVEDVSFGDAKAVHMYPHSDSSLMVAVPPHPAGKVIIGLNGVPTEISYTYA